MREMKADLIATLILGDGIEMGYFANVSQENAASVLRVNHEDAGSVALQNARSIFCLHGIETNSQQHNHRQN
jgi:hypothetical protein